MNADNLTFKNILDNLSGNIVIIDCNHFITYINSAALNFFNNVDSNFHDKFPYAKASDLIGKNVSEFHKNPEYQNNLLDNLADKIELCFKLGCFQVEVKVTPLIDESGQRLGSISEWQDVTNKKIYIELLAANQELAFQNIEKEKRAAELVIANQELAFQKLEKEKRAVELFIANENITVINEEYQAMHEELKLQNIEKERRAAELVIANAALAFQNIEKEKRAVELVIANQEKRAAKLEVIHLELMIEVMLHYNEKVNRTHELEIANQVIQQLAFYDELTKLANRRLLIDRLNHAMITSERTKEYGAVMFLDLDKFKLLNDNFGHDAGDALLIETANRLNNCVRKMDTVARFGGDEFVVLLNDLGDDDVEAKKTALTIAEKIRLTLAEPYQLNVGGKIIEHQCTSSIGIIDFIGITKSRNDILKQADDAMYQAKSSGRNAINFFTI